MDLRNQGCGVVQQYDLKREWGPVTVGPERVLATVRAKVGLDSMDGRANFRV